MTTTLLVNPSAGRGRAQALLPQVVGTLRDAGIDPVLRLSRDVAEARQMAYAAVDAGVERLLVLGGDGMMHLGVNAVVSRGGRTALGLLPAGTGNDLCRGLGLDPDDPVDGARRVAAGATRRVDVMAVGEQIVGTVLGSGFDALVNRRANAMTWPKGGLRYPLAVFAELRTFTPLAYRLTIDGEVRALQAMIVAIGNTSSYGGGMRICPDADPADGLLDLTIIHPVSRRRLLRLLPKLYPGTFVSDPCVERLRARSVRVEGAGLVGYGDGELIGAAPLQAEVRPGALTVFAPA